jgi:hypothetical protein
LSIVDRPIREQRIIAAISQGVFIIIDGILKAGLLVKNGRNNQLAVTALPRRDLYVLFLLYYCIFIILSCFMQSEELTVSGYGNDSIWNRME